MSSLQRSALEKKIARNCENCGDEYYAERRRYCSKECRIARDKGGKTYDEKKLAMISKCNERWLKPKSSRRKDIDPCYFNMTNY